MLKFNYKLFVGKHVDIVIYIVFIDGISLNMDKDMLDVTPLFKLVRSHILKALIHEANAMKEIISTSTTGKNMCERIIKMLNPLSVRTSSSDPAIINFEKDVAHVDMIEDMLSFE